MASRPTNREIKLARSLVHPEKTTRDETLEGLQQYLQSLTTYEELEMLKLWKALYYCYWLADKVPIQTELAERYSQLLHNLKSPELVLGYSRCFYRIILREWSLLDQYRVNKFYLLLRLFLREVFTYYFQLSHSKKSKKVKRDWSDLVQFHIVLQEEVLSKVPNGVRFHICDIYLPELIKVTKGELTTEQFLLAIRPFLDSIIDTTKEPAFIERVYKAILLKFLHEYSHEAAQIHEEEKEKKNSKMDTDEEEDTEEEKNTSEQLYFLQVNTKQLQKYIFDLASCPETNDRFRKKLYDLHKTYANQTGIPFITDEMLTNTKSTSNGHNDLVIESSHTVSVGQKRKHSEQLLKEDDDNVERNGKKKGLQEDKKENVKKTKKQKKSSSEEDPITATATTSTTSTTSIVPETTSKASKKSTSTRKEETVVAEEVVSTNTSTVSGETKKKKKVRVVESNNTTSPCTSSTAPSASGKTSPATNEETTTPTFIPSTKFSGAKPGYFFKKGKDGIGYYMDSPPKVSTPLKSALKKGSSISPSITMMNGKKQKKGFNK